MRGTTIIVGAHGNVPKDLERRPVEMEIRGKIGTIQITMSSRSARIFRRV